MYLFILLIVIYISLLPVKLEWFYIGAVTRNRMRSPFANRTNVYKCEDGRPICYCCLSVGHVGKYCWDRWYSCPHAAVLKASQPGQAPKCDFVDVQALGRDLDNLLKELQGITVELELSRTKPFPTEDFPTTTEGVVTDEKDQVEWLV